MPYSRPRSWELRELSVSKISPSRSISSESDSSESSPSSSSFWSSESGSAVGPETALMHRDYKTEWRKPQNTCCVFLSFSLVSSAPTLTHPKYLQCPPCPAHLWEPYVCVQADGDVTDMRQHRVTKQSNAVSPQ